MAHRVFWCELDDTAAGALVLTVDLWTDGANGGRSGTPGGWAAIVMGEGCTKIAISGYEASTTNNRMELFAVVRGLQALGKTRATVTIHTDSAYVKNAFTQGWIKKWQKNGWRTHKNDPVANCDLWDQLIALAGQHVVKWKKVKGHGNTALNNEVDALAVAAKLSGEETFALL